MLKEFEKNKDFFVYKFSADPKSDPLKKTTWAEANPFIRENLKAQKFQNVVSFYEKKAVLAKNSKKKDISFRHLFLGQSFSVDALGFVDVEKIKIVSEDIYKNKSIRWSAGADLSTYRDFTAFSLVGIGEIENLYVKFFLYLLNLESRRQTQTKQFLS